MTITEIVLVRHGESQWNKENRFTGWCDIDLSKKGISEAKEAGKLLKRKGFIFDFAYTSVLKRAIHTLWKILDELDQIWIPVEKSWKLNERHYGALQGLNKEEIAKKHGEEKVKQWRRSFTIIPPKLTKNDKRFPGYDPRYSKLTEDDFPLAESLELTFNRIVPYWKKEILPRLKNGERIIVVAHGNSIRALLKYINNISDEEISNLNIPTGIPLVYRFNNDFQPIEYYYLNNPNKIINNMI